MISHNRSENPNNMHLLTKLGRAGRENSWLQVRANWPSAATIATIIMLSFIGKCRKDARFCNWNMDFLGEILCATFDALVEIFIRWYIFNWGNTAIQCLETKWSLLAHKPVCWIVDNRDRRYSLNWARIHSSLPSQPGGGKRKEINY